MYAATTAIIFIYLRKDYQKCKRTEQRNGSEMDETHDTLRKHIAKIKKKSNEKKERKEKIWTHAIQLNVGC